jgi:outer membrane protein OmpA-like peptidoglycan-associated protein
MTQYSHLIADRVCAVGAALVVGVWTAVAPLAALAQDENPNLVKNPSFEEVDFKRLKNPGMFAELQADWYPANLTPLDVFAPGVKNLKISVPSNMYGMQEASEGQSYIGFRAYSKDPKLTRSYVETQLTEKLAANQMYCVQFDISLSDLSRFSVNGIGASFSDRKVVQNNTAAMPRERAVMHATDKVMDVMDVWETVCGTYIARGNESYLIIGGFKGDSEVQVGKPKKPASVPGVQKNEAYYYLDNVRVFAVEAKSQCGCGKAEEPRTDLVYGSSVVMSDNMTPEEIVGVSAVYFAYLKRAGTSAGDETVAKVAAILKANPSWKLRLVGHCDDDEFNEGKVNARYRELGQKRAEQIQSQFVAAGIDASRLIIETKENADPASTRDTDISRAQNRRVIFQIVK